MKCNVCDKQLGEKEIIWNTEIQAWEMCGTCLAESMDAAFCDGFLKEDDDMVIIEDSEYGLLGSAYAAGVGDASDIYVPYTGEEYD